VKYVVLEFDSDDDADAFASTMQTVHEEPTQTIRVRGIFKKPSQFCECPPSKTSVRGQKWGWWIHKDCGKPKRGQWQHARNLLDPIDIPASERNIWLGVVEGGPKYGRTGSWKPSNV